MTADFKTTISGQPSHWMLEVPDARHFGKLRSAQHGPRVAFTALKLPEPAVRYLAGLSYGRHYGPNSPYVHDTGQITDSPMDNMTTCYFEIDGWHKDPNDSVAAKAAFCRKAAAFFPDREGRAELLKALAEHTAQKASGLDRERLPFLFRAMPQGKGDSRLHLDPGSEIVSIDYLRGNTTPHADPRTYTAQDIVTGKFNGDHDLPEIALTDSIKAGLRAPPPLTSAAWRGTQLEAASPHMQDDNHDLLRIICLTEVSAANTRPARTTTPSLLQRIQSLRPFK